MESSRNVFDASPHSIFKNLVDNVGLAHAGEIFSKMTLENWIALAEKEWGSAFIALQSFDFASLYENDGWYKLYKIIISKSPTHIQYIPPNVTRDNKMRLTPSQYNELCDLAGDAYTSWGTSLNIEKERKELNIKNALEEFMEAIKS